MGKLFGTDGIRGLAGEFPLDEATVRVVGAALARELAAELGREPRLVTGRDTRESGDWIERAFHQGARSEAAEVFSAGVITTPGVAFVTGAEGLDAGVVISASHNPFQDNGLKIFTPSGKKAGTRVEEAIEAAIFGGTKVDLEGGDIDTSRMREFREKYVDHLASGFPGLDLSGKRILVDCANGAACEYAPRILDRLGADANVVHNSPNGRNINENCGSLHLDDLKGIVKADGFHFGVAFDGDADRALFVDENGEVVDGDAVLWVMARYFRSHGKLAKDTVVATVMSNIGLELALRSIGVELKRTAVGDKYVLDELLAGGASLGGEQSGHIIFPERSIVGDGILTALYLAQAVGELGGTLSRAVEGFVRYPQVLVNVKVKEKRPFEDLPLVTEAASAVERNLNGSGRLLLRYSGTENLARVMIEGKDQAEIDVLANSLAETIKAELG